MGVGLMERPVPSTGELVSLPTWTILIPTLGERRELFGRLLDCLLPQVEPYRGRVRILAYWNNGERPLTEIRQALLMAPATDYVNFIDDDDLVSNFYVDRIVESLKTGPDMVGWQAQCYHNGRPTWLAVHSLEYGDWYQRNGVLYRDFSHTNTMRRELAVQADFRITKPGAAEDLTWVQQLRGKVTSCVYVPEIMYHYYYVPKASTWSNPRRISQGPWEPIYPDSLYFSYHPECVAWNQ